MSIERAKNKKKQLSKIALLKRGSIFFACLRRIIFFVGPTDGKDKYWKDNEIGGWRAEIWARLHTGGEFIRGADKFERQINWVWVVERASVLDFVKGAIEPMKVLKKTPLPSQQQRNC